MSIHEPSGYLAGSLLVTLCFCTYRFIELPGMAATARVHAKVLAVWKWLGSRGAALPGR